MDLMGFGARFVSLGAVRDWLDDRVVVLESEEAVAKKLAAGKEAELWCFDAGKGGVIRRGDGKFHEIGVLHHPGGWGVAGVNEEPNITELDPEGRRIVGHVIVEKNAAGEVRVRKNKGLSGEILELQPSSITKGELADAGEVPVGYMEANPQRIKGFIAVYVRTMEFAEGTTVMSPAEFAAQSTDGRSITALAKAGLLK